MGHAAERKGRLNSSQHTTDDGRDWRECVRELRLGDRSSPGGYLARFNEEYRGARPQVSATLPCGRLEVDDRDQDRQ